MKKFISTIVLLFVANIALAQPAGPGSPVPFGFVELLIGAGAIYGGKKTLDARKEKEQDH
jgi:hypothetical protein